MLRFSVSRTCSQRLSRIPDVEDSEATIWRAGGPVPSAGDWHVIGTEVDGRRVVLASCLTEPVAELWRARFAGLPYASVTVEKHAGEAREVKLAREKTYH